MEGVSVSFRCVRGLFNGQFITLCYAICISIGIVLPSTVRGSPHQKSGESYETKELWLADGRPALVIDAFNFPYPGSIKALAFELRPPGVNISSKIVPLHTKIILLSTVTQTTLSLEIPLDILLFGQSFYDIDYMGNVPQADGRPIALDMCPQVPKVLPTGGCDLKECRSDRECALQGLMCCYNGCVYTCLPQVRPAPFFDWLKQPRRRLQYGSSWLVQGRNQDSDVVICSTTPPDDDSDPLICPHGYQCVIDDQGIPSKGVPNTGHCVQSVDTSSEEKYNFDIQIPQGKADLEDIEEPEHHCKIIGNKKLISGHSAILNGKNCLCYETKLICEE